MPASSRILHVLLVSMAGAALPVGATYLNTTAGGMLRPGVYGRIEIGKAPPPPLFYSHPVVASQIVLPGHVKPVYLYVPPGQVRKWKQHCAKYKACDLPVFFVRFDNSPSKLGSWKTRGNPAARAAGGLPERQP